MPLARNVWLSSRRLVRHYQLCKVKNFVDRRSFCRRLVLCLKHSSERCQVNNAKQTVPSRVSNIRWIRSVPSNCRSHAGSLPLPLPVSSPAAHEVALKAVRLTRVTVTNFLLFKTEFLMFFESHEEPNQHLATGHRINQCPLLPPQHASVFVLLK